MRISHNVPTRSNKFWKSKNWVRSHKFWKSKFWSYYYYYFVREFCEKGHELYGQHFSCGHKRQAVWTTKTWLNNSSHTVFLWKFLVHLRPIHNTASDRPTNRTFPRYKRLTCAYIYVYIYVCIHSRIWEIKKCFKYPTFSIISN